MRTNRKPAFHALLVEGVPGIGKSTLIDALVRQHVEAADARQIRSFLHLSQSHTYGPLAPEEDAGMLSASENLRLLERIVQMLEWMHDDLRASGKPAYVLVDCLHLTHCLRPGVIRWEDAEPFDRRLARLGCRLVLLTASAGTIWERSILLRAESQFLKGYAQKFGRSHEELHAHFIREQEKFLQMFEQSSLPKLVLRTDGNLDDVVHQARAFWLD